MEVAREVSFTAESRRPYGEGLVAVRILASRVDAIDSNCGVLVFTLDEWFAFHALLAGRADAVTVTFRGFDEARTSVATPVVTENGDEGIDTDSDSGD